MNVVHGRVARTVVVIGVLLVAVLPPMASGAGSLRGPVADVDAQALGRVVSPPLGLPPVPVPADVPLTPAKIALGRKLFFDRGLSHNGTMSCGMCHIPEQGFTNNELARPVGAQGRSLRRNAPTVLNVAYARSLFHDGRETRLETQIISPLLDHREMANPSIGYLIGKIESLPGYRRLFEQAFGAPPSIDRVGQAIASYQRTLLVANSPFDRWYFGGDGDAVSPLAAEGFRLFTGRAGCVACHTVEQRHALFTDQAFHDTGLGYYNTMVQSRSRAPVSVELTPGLTVSVPRDAIESVGDPRAPDLGRYEVTLNPTDLWRFRTPSLRNVGLTAPYMHDGSMTSLAQVVEFYSHGGHAHPGRDSRIRPLRLAEREVAALVAFLESLTGDDVGILITEARAAAADR